MTSIDQTTADPAGGVGNRPAPGARDGDTRPTIGLVGLWHGRESWAWSGVPTRIMDALDELGLFGGYLDATPWPPAFRAVRRLPRPLSGVDGIRIFDAAPRTLLGASNVVSRVRSRGRCDAWIVPAMGYGRPVGGRIASLCEITPAQLGRAEIEVVRSMWPRISDRQLRAFRRQQVRLHRRATVCCVASHWAGSSLVRDHGIEPDRVHVVGYGANVRAEPPADRDWSAPRFLFVGNAWRRKNGDRVISAFARLRDTCPGATLDVVGDHPRIDVPGVTGHGERRLITDAEGRALLASLYRRATCFVLPSLHESFGIVYVEAAAAGLPCIGTTEGGTGDSIGEGGVLVNPRDDEALTAAMLRLANPDEARRLGAVALRRSGLFTWRKVAERIVRALDLPGVDSAALAPPL
jgi:glycogen synthase